MVKRNKKCKAFNKLELYLNEVFKDPRNPRGDFKILDNALEFLYIDSNDVGVNLRDLYNDALRTKKFRDLKVLINEWLGSRVSKETVVTIIIIAEDHKNENLKKKALKFIHNNIDILACKQWENLHKYKELRDEIYKMLLISMFKKNKELSQKVCDIAIDQTEEYEFPIRSVCKDEEQSIKQSLIENPSIEELSIEELLVKQSRVEENPIQESSIEDTTIEDLSIEESSIEELSIEESVIEEVSIEGSVIEDLSIEGSVIEEISMEEPIIIESIIEVVPIEKPSKEKLMTNDDLPSTSSKTSTTSGTTAEISGDNKIEEDKPPVKSSRMVKIGILNHSDGSGFQSYVAIKLSKEELNVQTDKEQISCNENFISEADENLYTSYKTHFIPIKITRLLYIKKIDVNSIEKHAFNNSIDVIANCSPAPVSPKFNTMLSKSESNSSQSLCSNLTEVLLNTCEHSLVTKCTICSENAELKKKQDEDEENVMVDNNLPPIEMFNRSKTNEEKGKKYVSSWVEQTTLLTEEQRIAKQKYDDLEARVALAKDNWNEVPIDYTPDPKEMEIFNSKLDKAFNELITVRTNISRRLLPVELNENVVYNSFEALKQKAERRFEMLHKGIHIPEGFDFDAIPSCPRIYDEPITEETDDVSNPKFFAQNKNIKFFKSNQNSFSNQRRMRQPGQQNNVYFF